MNISIGNIALFIVLAIFLVVTGVFLMDRMRDKKLSEIATKLGLSYDKEDPDLIETTFKGFEFFARQKEGCYRKCKNIRRGSYVGKDILIFDFLWKGSPNSQSQNMIYQTIIAVPSKEGVAFHLSHDYWEIESKNGWALYSPTAHPNSGASNYLISPANIESYLKAVIEKIMHSHTGK
jgi:hypothetical protein